MLLIYNGQLKSLEKEKTMCLWAVTYPRYGKNEQSSTDTNFLILVFHLKLKTIYECFLSPIKCRGQCYASLHSNFHEHLWLIVPYKFIACIFLVSFVTLVGFTIAFTLTIVEFPPALKSSFSKSFLNLSCCVKNTTLKAQVLFDTKKVGA